MGGEGDIFVMRRSTIIGLHTIAPPRLWVVSQFEILATPITGRTGTGSVFDCGVIRPAPGSSASEMGTSGQSRRLKWDSQPIVRLASLGHSRKPQPLAAVEPREFIDGEIREY